MNYFNPKMLRKSLTEYPVLMDVDGLSGYENDAVGRPTLAAVLILIIGYSSGEKVVLTKRSPNLSKHAGQISFPGGRCDHGDEDIVATALRETREEIGVKKDGIEILGTLPQYDILSGFRITPVVGWTTKRPTYTLNSGEVSEVFELPLKFLLDPSNHKKHMQTIGGEKREYYSIFCEDRYVWGATAGILVNLHRIIKMQES